MYNKISLLQNLSQYNNDIISTENIKNIFVNEGQFFDDLDKWLYNMQSIDINIWVSGLDYDYKQKPFGKILACIPLSDEFHKLNSTCTCCKGIANYTKRTSPDKKKF